MILYCCCFHGGCISVEPQISHPANKTKIPRKLGLTKGKTHFYLFNLRVMLLSIWDKHLRHVDSSSRRQLVHECRVYETCSIWLYRSNIRFNIRRFRVNVDKILSIDALSDSGFGNTCFGVQILSNFGFKKQEKCFWSGHREKCLWCYNFYCKLFTNSCDGPSKRCEAEINSSNLLFLLFWGQKKIFIKKLII